MFAKVSESFGITKTIYADGWWRRRSPTLGIDFGLVGDNETQGVGVKPWRRYNICPSLLLKENGKPERDFTPVRRAQCRRSTLSQELETCSTESRACNASAHGKEADAFEPQPGHNCDKLHFTQKGHFRRH